MAKKTSSSVSNFPEITGAQLIKLIKDNKWENKTITFGIDIENSQMENESGGDISGSVTNHILVFGNRKNAELRLQFLEEDSDNEE